MTELTEAVTLRDRVLKRLDHGGRDPQRCGTADAWSSGDWDLHKLYRPSSEVAGYCKGQIPPRLGSAEAETCTGYTP